MTVVLAPSKPFTIRTMAGCAVLAAEPVECANKEQAIEVARSRLVKAVPGVSVEVWEGQSMLWSSLTDQFCWLWHSYLQWPALPDIGSRTSHNWRLANLRRSRKDPA